MKWEVNNYLYSGASIGNNDGNSLLKNNAVLSKVEQVNTILGINQYLKAILNIYSSYIIGVVLIISI